VLFGLQLIALVVFLCFLHAFTSNKQPPHTIVMVGEAPERASSLPYHEPGIVIILVFTSFLLLLNIINAVLDRLLYCGLLGQVLIGIAWGTPGAKWLSLSIEETIVQLGYLGLILLVYEGTSTHSAFVYRR
jgi:hypothetical protein